MGARSEGRVTGRHDCGGDAPARLRPWLLVCLGLAAGPAVALDAGIEAGYLYDSNVALAANEADELADHVWQLGATADFRQPLGANTRLVYRLQARGEVYSEYTGLSHLLAGAGVTLQYRHSGLLRTPVFAAFLRAALDEYDSEMRDSTLFTLGASLRQHLTDRLSYAVVLSGTVRDSDSAVFDNNEGALLLHLDQRLLHNWSVYFSYQFARGEFVASGAPTLTIVNAADRIQPDDALGGAAADVFAYRLTGSRHVVTLGTNLAFGGRQALDLSVRYASAQADDDLDYDRWQAGLSYLLRF